jgi:hypothetical protein
MHLPAMQVLERTSLALSEIYRVTVNYENQKEKIHHCAHRTFDTNKNWAAIL